MEHTATLLRAGIQPSAALHATPQIQSPQMTQTEIAAARIKAMLNGATMTNLVTGQPEPLIVNDVRITTGTQGNDGEHLSVHVDVKNLHDVGVANVNNAVEDALRQFPTIGKNFEHVIEGVSGEELRAKVASALTQAGVPAQQQAGILAWEGFNSGTGTPKVNCRSGADATPVMMEFMVATEDAKDTSPVNHSPFKELVDQMKESRGAIMTIVADKAQRVTDEHGKPVFTPEQIATLKAEKMVLNTYEYSQPEVDFQIGARKTDEETAKKSSDELNGSDLKESVLSSLDTDVIRDLVRDAVIQAIPDAYPKLAGPHLLRTNLEFLTEGKVDISNILAHEQLSAVKESWNQKAGDTRRIEMRQSPHSSRESDTLTTANLHFPIGVPVHQIVAEINGIQQAPQNAANATHPPATQVSNAESQGMAAAFASAQHSL